MLPDAGVRFIGEAVELPGQLVGGAVGGDVEEIGFQVAVWVATDLYADSPAVVADGRAVGRRFAEIAAVFYGDRVAREMDRCAANVADVFGFVAVERVQPVRGQHDEESVESQVVNVCQTGQFPACSRLSRDVDAVLIEQFRIHTARLFVVGNRTGHVEPVSVGQVATYQLLYEPD